MLRRLVDREQLRRNRMGGLAELAEFERDRAARTVEWEHRRGVCEDVEDVLVQTGACGSALYSGRAMWTRRRLAEAIADYILQG